jgi:hypothetical protein
VVGQAEVIVRAEQQHRPTVEHHLRALRPVDQAEPSSQPLGLQLIQALS